MRHQHTYRPLSTLTLSLPTAEGIYEALVIYQCACRRVDAYDMAVSNRRPMPTWEEVHAVAQWQHDYPERARQQRRL
jgi:hypothetical protein